MKSVSLLASREDWTWIGRMALFGSVTTVRSQAPQLPGLQVAFSYVEELMRRDSVAYARIRSIARGESKRVELGSGVFAIEQVYETKPRPEGFFESHQKYIDVQVVAEGEELMEVVDISRIAVREPYAAERDLVIYNDTADGASGIRVSAGEAAIFFPVDVHMPSLRLGSAPVLVRKSVVKVPVH